MDCYLNPPRVMSPWFLAYKTYQTEVVRFSLKIFISALTCSDNIMVLIQRILENLFPIPSSPIDEIFYVMKVT